MAIRQDGISANPWFREPWPWILMSGPAIVVVAGVITVVLALRTQDGLVADDYYKQGMAVNKSMQRDRVAHERGYAWRAEVKAGANGGLALQLEEVGATLHTDALQLSLSHATRSNKDQMLTLRRDRQGRFAAPLSNLDEGKWYVTLEDASKAWRLTGEVIVRGGVVPQFVLSASPSATDAGGGGAGGG
jgi:uncharacterized protein